jgi:hypothetical protein
MTGRRISDFKPTHYDESMIADPTSPRRRFQFRLRTLMIGVTLLAIALAVPLGWWCVHEVQIAQEKLSTATSDFRHVSGVGRPLFLIRCPPLEPQRERGSRGSAARRLRDC